MKWKDLLGSPANALLGTLATALVGALIAALGKKMKSSNPTTLLNSTDRAGDSSSATMRNFEGQSSSKGQGLGGKGQGLGSGGGQGGCGA